MKDADKKQLLAVLRDGVRQACETLDVDDAFAYLEFTLSRILPQLRLGSDKRLPDLTGDQSEEQHSNWKYIVKRSHPWKRQLFVPGRNMTAAQLAKAADNSSMSNEEAGQHFGLEPGIVAEARDYAIHHFALIRYEDLVDWLMLEVYRGKNPLEDGNDE